MSRQLDIVNEIADEAGFIAAAAEIVDERCSPDNDNPNQTPTASISLVMGRVLRSAENIDKLIQELHHLSQEGEQPPDTSADDVLDPPSAAGIEIGQHFDALDAEQQDTIRRVLRQFPL